MDRLRRTFAWGLGSMTFDQRPQGLTETFRLQRWTERVELFSSCHSRPAVLPRTRVGRTVVDVAGLLGGFDGLRGHGLRLQCHRRLRRSVGGRQASRAEMAAKAG